MRSRRVVKGIAKKRKRKKDLEHAVEDLIHMGKEHYPGEHALIKKQQDANVTDDIVDDIVVDDTVEDIVDELSDE